MQVMSGFWYIVHCIEKTKKRRTSARADGDLPNGTLAGVRRRAMALGGPLISEPRMFASQFLNKRVLRIRRLIGLLQGLAELPTVDVRFWAESGF